MIKNLEIHDANNQVVHIGDAYIPNCGYGLGFYTESGSDLIHVVWCNMGTEYWIHVGEISKHRWKETYANVWEFYLNWSLDEYTKNRKKKEMAGER